MTPDGQACMDATEALLVRVDARRGPDWTPPVAMIPCAACETTFDCWRPPGVEPVHTMARGGQVILQPAPPIGPEPEPGAEPDPAGRLF